MENHAPHTTSFFPIRLATRVETSVKNQTKKNKKKREREKDTPNPGLGWQRPAIDFRGRGLGLVGGAQRHRILGELRNGIVGKWAATLRSAMRRLKRANTTILHLSSPAMACVDQALIRARLGKRRFRVTAGLRRRFRHT